MSEPGLDVIVIKYVYLQWESDVGYLPHFQCLHVFLEVLHNLIVNHNGEIFGLPIISFSRAVVMQSRRPTHISINDVEE